MKILLLWPFFHPIPKAAAIRGEAFARHLAEMGNQVYVITPRKNDNLHIQKDHSRQYYVRRMRTYDSYSEKHGFIASVFFAPFSLLALRKEIIHLQPDLIIASSPAPFLALEGFLSSRSEHTPFVYDMRDSWHQEEYTHRGMLRNRMKRAIEQWLCREVDLVFCVTESLRGSTVSDYSLPDWKVRLVTNGAEPPKESNGPSGKSYDLVFLGYPADNRDIPELLRAIAMVSERMQIRMLRLGWKDTPEERELRNMIGGLGIEENIFMKPPIPHEEVAGELSKATIGVISLSGEKPLASAIGTKTYEYLAAGLPVACLSRLTKSELRDLIVNNEIGFYSRNSEDFAEKLVDLLSAKNEISRLRENARALSSKYQWKSIVFEAYERHLKDLGGSQN